MAYSEYEYDVFVSHAIEDKTEIANDLVRKLEDAKIKVWYSGHRLRVGRRIDKTIREGLNKSRHGIVILTHNFFKKNWPKKELHALWLLENDEDRRILPVWHNITEEEIRKYDPILANNYGLSTNNGQDIDLVVEKLVQSIQENGRSISTRNAPFSLLALKLKPLLYALFLIILISIGTWFILIRDIPSNELILSKIEERVETFQAEVIRNHNMELNKNGGTSCGIHQVIEKYDLYMNLKSHYRNGYYFNTGYSDYSFKKNVEPAIDVALDALTPYDNYGFTYPNIFEIDHRTTAPAMNTKYILLNSQPVQFEITSERKNETQEYLVEVTYQNHIRYLSVHFTYSKQSNWMKRKHTTFQGFLPKEIYRFIKEEDDQWVFAGIE